MGVVAFSNGDYPCALGIGGTGVRLVQNITYNKIMLIKGKQKLRRLVA